MTRRRRRINGTGRSKESEQYAPLSYDMIQSQAWRSLSGPAVKVWLELRARYNGGNNGRLILSLDEGQRLLRLGKATIKRALDELQEKGFLVLTRRGRWYGRLASTWAVTDKGVDSMPPTRAWKRWPQNVGSTSVLIRTEKTEVGSEAEPCAV